MPEQRELQGVDYFQWLRIMLRIQFGSNTGTTSATTIRAIAYTLAMYTNTATGDQAYPGIARLARNTESSTRTVKRVLAFLEKHGLIEAVRRGSSFGRGGKGMATEYRLTIPSDLLEVFELLDPEGEETQGTQMAPDTQEQGPQVSPETQEQGTHRDGTGANCAEQGTHRDGTGDVGGLPPTHKTPTHKTPAHRRRRIAKVSDLVGLENLFLSTDGEKARTKNEAPANTEADNGAWDIDAPSAPGAWGDTQSAGAWGDTQDPGAWDQAANQ